MSNGGGLGDLLVSVRASADAFAADIANMQRSANAFAASLKNIPKGLDDTERSGKRAGEGVRRSMMDAHAALSTIEEMLGVHLPRAATRFLVESESIGPLLTAAFSSVAVVGLISILGELPEAFRKISAAITGWDEAAKKAFDDQIKANKELVASLEEHRLKMLELQKLSSGENAEQAAIETLNEKLNTAQKKFDDYGRSVQDANKHLNELRGSMGSMPVESAAPLQGMINKAQKDLADLNKLWQESGKQRDDIQRQFDEEQEKGRGTQFQEELANFTKLRDADKAMQESRKQFHDQIALESIQATRQFGEQQAADEAKKLKDSNGRWAAWADAQVFIQKKIVESGHKMVDDIMKQSEKWISVMSESFSHGLEESIKFEDALLSKINELDKQTQAAKLSAAEADATTTNGRLKAVDDWYAAEKKAIQNNVQDFRIRQRQLLLLDTEAAAKRSAVERASFEELKQSAGHVFDDLIAGRTLNIFRGTALTAARDMFSTFEAELLMPFKKQWEELTKWMTGLFKGLADHLTEWLGGALKGATKGASDAAGGAGQGAASGATDSAGKFSLGGLVKGASIAAAASLAVVGIEKLGSAIFHMFGSLRRQADEFVKNIQNPFGDSVKSLFDGLTAAKDAGKLTFDQAKDAKDEFESMWKTFQEQAAKQGVVGQQALATMNQFVPSWRAWLDGLEEAGKELEKQKEIMDRISSVKDATKGMDNLAIAIQTLQQDGVSTAAIIEYLGGDVESFVKAANLLHVEIPAAVSGIYDLIEAIKRIAELDDQIAATKDQLSAALNHKVDMLDQAINAVQDSIASMTDELAGLYDKYTNQRASMEKEIEQLDTKIQRDALTKALDEAKKKGGVITALVQNVTEGIAANGHHFATLMQSTKTFGGNQAAIDAAQATLDAFDAVQSEKQHQADLERLNYLKDNLPKVIDAQEHAAKALTALGMAIPNDQFDRELDIDLRRIDALKELIPQQYKRLEQLYADKDATEKLMKAMGIARTNEWDDTNKSILALIDRGNWLEQERNALLALNGETEKATNYFKSLAIAMSEASSAPGSATAQATTTALSFGRFGPLGPVLPSYDVGTLSVPVTGPAIVHQGEMIIPADQKWGSTVNVYVQGDVISEDQLLRKVTRGIDRMVKKGSLTLTASGLKR